MAEAENKVTSINTAINDLNSSASELNEMESTTTQKFTFSQLEDVSAQGSTDMVNGCNYNDVWIG
ncbi:MAG TPA: hypothetical protein VKB19_05775, partial [Pedobacter sp.]|nr:hypothetical protein [Pedobacter sp.]